MSSHAESDINARHRCARLVRPGRSRLFILRIRALSLCAAAISCAPEGDSSLNDEPDETEVLVRSDEIPSDLPEWSIGEQPLVTLGNTTSQDPELFGRLDGAAFLPDGRIVVADGLNLEVRAFSPDGVHQWSSGGAGRGPGEFVQLSRVDVMADGSVLASARAAPANLYTSKGEFLRAVHPPSVEGSQGPVLILGATSDGRLVASAPLQPEPDKGHWRGRQTLFVLEMSGQVVHRLPGTWPMGDFFRFRASDGRSMSRRAPPSLARATQVAMGPGGFVVNVQDDFTLWLHESSGELVRTIQVVRPRRPVDDHIRRKYVEGPLAGLDDPQVRNQIRRSREDDFLPPELPETRQVIIDSEGRIWVEEFSFPNEPSSSWWVLNPSGEFVARALLPRGPLVDVRAIADDRVLLTRAGELGPPLLEVWPLLK